MMKMMATVPRSKRTVAVAAAVFACFAALSLGAVIALADEAATTAAILDRAEHDDAHKAITQDLTRRAREAMDRATRMRAAGDETHARQADLVAREWADAAQDLARAADAEAKSAAARRSAIDAGAQADRERALLEEGIARNGRLRALLDQTAREKTQAPARTSTAALDAGVIRPRPPAAPANDAGGER